MGIPSWADDDLSEDAAVRYVHIQVGRAGGHGAPSLVYRKPEACRLSGLMEEAGIGEFLGLAWLSIASLFWLTYTGRHGYRPS